MTDYPIDTEVLSQTDEDIFVLAQKLVNLAVGVLLKQESVEHDAIVLLADYAELSKIDFPQDVEKKIEAYYAGDEEEKSEEAKKPDNASSTAGIIKADDCPIVIFPVTNENSDNTIWLQVRPNVYGVEVVVHKSEPELVNGFDSKKTAIAQILVDYFTSSFSSALDDDLEAETLKVHLWNDKQDHDDETHRVITVLDDVQAAKTQQS